MSILLQANLFRLSLFQILNGLSMVGFQGGQCLGTRRLKFEELILVFRTKLIQLRCMSRAYLLQCR